MWPPAPHALYLPTVDPHELATTTSIPILFGRVRPLSGILVYIPPLRTLGSTPTLACLLVAACSTRVSALVICSSRYTTEE